MRWTTVVMVPALLALTGCDRGGDGGPASSTAAQFAEDLLQAYGTRAARCGPETAAAIRQELRATLDPEHVWQAEQEGRLGLDEVQARACLASLESAQCVELEAVRSGCAAAFVPHVKEGGDCTLFLDLGITAECIDGECVGESELACSVHGMCVRLAGEGEPCDVPLTYRDCAAGLSCQDGTCVALPPVVVHDTVGDPCDDQDDVCGDALYCAGNTCQPRARQGQDCSTAVCELGSSCDGSTCVPWKGVGADCTVGSHECVAGAFCDRGNCAALPSSGGACGTPVGEESRSCVDSWCELDAAVGKAAYVEATGTCQAYLSVGDLCEARLTSPLVGRGWYDEACGPGRICDPESSTCVEYYCRPRKP